ncbi:MAG: hydrogenase maturation nickel metallochaperone HypA [Fibrobacteria bacterium]|nr:hydrogenase maturation nickel metallochaperone HypA [Fibrobacteria bacterium]
MHEVSIAESILDLIERQLGRPRELSEVAIRLGPLSGVSADSLDFCFPTVAFHKGFGSPILTLERTLVTIRCDACGTTYHLPDPISPCPSCHSWHRTILGGDEFELLSATLSEENHV